jgi:LPS-assembly protein
MNRSIGSLALVGALLTLPSPAIAQENGPFSSCGPADGRFSIGMRSEPIADRPGANRITLSGDVQIDCGDTRISADQIVYEDDTKHILATGRVNFQQSDFQIYAERAELNGSTKLGSFFNATGTASLGEPPDERNQFGTRESDIMFRAEEIAKVGPKRYRLRDGWFTTCVQASPRWSMGGSYVTIALDEYVLMRNMVLRVKDVPLLFLPAMYYPINKDDRSTGFLLPTYGGSTIGGTSLSNAFFWAISRSQDATFYHDWNSRLGQGYKAEYRYVTAPGSQGNLAFHLMDESIPAQGATPATTRRSYRLNGGAAQNLPKGFYLAANSAYFTQPASQQRLQNIADYSRRDRSWSATLTGSIQRLRLSVAADQSDYFYGTEPGQRSGRRPSVNLSLPDRPIGGSRVYYGASGDAAYLVRQNDLKDPATDRSLWRFDTRPTLRAPLSRLPYLSATGQVSWRLTRWSESIDPATGLVVPLAITRQLAEMNATVVGPVLARVFQTPNNGYAERFKHLIEPSFRLSRTTPFTGYQRVVKTDYVDGVVGGTTTFNYRLSNKLLARRRGPSAGGPNAPAAPGIVREILTVDLQQTYYSDASAALYDPNYQSGSVTATTKGTFGSLQLTAVTRPTDTASGQFRMEIDSKYRKVREYGATGTVESSLVQVMVGWSKRPTIPEIPQFGPARHFLNATTTLRTRGNSVGGTYGMNLDVKNGDFLQQRIVAYYNTQCCGVSFDWQSISTPLYNVPADRRFGVSFTLAGIGSFSNPMGSFGGR